MTITVAIPDGALLGEADEIVAAAIALAISEIGAPRRKITVRVVREGEERHTLSWHVVMPDGAAWKE